MIKISGLNTFSFFGGGGEKGVVSNRASQKESYASALYCAPEGSDYSACLHKNKL